VYNSDYTAVIDCGSSSGEDAGTITAEYIYSLGRNRIDALVLTHYHSDHANGVKKLMAMVDVDTFILPLPENDESTLDEKIIELATDAGSDIIYVTEDTDVTMGDTEMYLYAPMGSESENERGVCILVAEDDFETLITGDVNSTIEKTLVSTEKIPDIECLIVGHHGSKYSTGYELLKAVKPDIAIISVGENDYGHPTEETLERLANQKIPVYRTDELGNITINSVNSLE
jgi:competence protein ComEC